MFYENSFSRHASKTGTFSRNIRCASTTETLFSTSANQERNLFLRNAGTLEGTEKPNLKHISITGTLSGTLGFNFRNLKTSGAFPLQELFQKLKNVGCVAVAELFSGT